MSQYKTHKSVTHCSFEIIEYAGIDAVKNEIIDSLKDKFDVLPDTAKWHYAHSEGSDVKIVLFISAKEKDE